MKHNLLAILFALFALHSKSAEPIELVVYAEKSSANLNFETFSTNILAPRIRWTFPSSYTGHRAVCRLQGAKTNDVFTAWVGDGSFRPGMPFGCSNLLDIPQIGLTPLSHVFARVNLYTGEDDRVMMFGTDSGDIPAESYTNLPHAPDAIYGLATNEYEHVRIVPFIVGGIRSDTPPGSLVWTNCYPIVTNRVVAEFDISKTTKPCITEADFLRDGTFDIDWDGFDTEIASMRKIIGAVGDVTAVKYRIVFGKEGSVGRESNLADETEKVRAFSTLIERRYEPKTARTLPTALKTDGIVHGAQPTFKWRLDEKTDTLGYSPSSSLFGCSYTAFQIEVYNRDTNKKVYDSGLVRAPAKDANGFFTWTAPLQLQSGNWKWRVVMNNAKFLPEYNDLGWSAYATFSTSVDTQQD